MCCPRQDDCEEKVLEAKIGDLLASRDANLVGQGITLVHQRYARPITRRLRACFPGLSSGELADAWNRTLIQLTRRALNGQFHVQGSLYGLNWRIAFCRAVDLLRRQNRWRRCRQASEESLEIASMIGPERNMMVEELLEAIRAAIRELPGQQRLVWEAYADLQFERHKEDLVAEASKRAGKMLSWNTVRRALQEGKQKVIRSLRRRGYFR